MKLRGTRKANAKAPLPWEDRLGQARGEVEMVILVGCSLIFWQFYVNGMILMIFEWDSIGFKL